MTAGGDAICLGKFHKSLERQWLEEVVQKGMGMAGSGGDGFGQCCIRDSGASRIPESII
jgi:hypothetical protein